MQNQSINSELDRLAEELTLRREVDEYGAIYYFNEQNQYHRIHGPAVIYPDGVEFWYQNGKPHRLDGPASIRHNGATTWYQNGERHRLDGPAVIWPNGDKRWFINCKPYTEEEFNTHPDVIAYAKSKQQ